MVASGDQWPDWPQGRPHAPCPSPAVNTPAAVRAPRALPSPAGHLSTQVLPFVTRGACRETRPVALTRGSTSCSGPWCGAGLQAPGRGLRPRDRGQEPPSALTPSAPRCLSAASCCPGVVLIPAQPLGFSLIHGTRNTEMRSALCLVGAGWDPECRQTLPPQAGSLRSVTRVARSSGGAAVRP